jgi:hypothetical protein
MHPGELTVENRVAPEVRADLVRRGHRLWVQPAWSQGNNAGIVVEQSTGTLSAGADPRNTATALAMMPLSTTMAISISMSEKPSRVRTRAMELIMAGPPPM